MSSSAQLDELRTLLETIPGEQAETLVRRPVSTVAPPHDGRLGQKALEVLKTLSHDPNALVDEGHLAKGGMGEVRLARQVALDRRVAVKTVKPELKGQNDVEALLAEAWLTGGLEHPNILPVYSLSLDPNGRPVLVMKRIEGRTWSVLMHDAAAMTAHAADRPPLEEHLRIFQAVCNAVHFAHSRGVVHRDLKPDNVMVGSFGEVYVVDWGIATTVGPATQLAGTPAYMAPEMLGAAGAQLTARTDVYLLGSILCELLSGKPPHTGTNPRELFDAVIRSKPTLPADAPEELADLCRRCMHPLPEQRPESALEVRRAIDAFLQHQGSVVLAAQSARRALELVTLVTAPTPDRSLIDATFSACRFGLQQALVAWPGNTRARDALSNVLETMARFELKHGSPRAAQVLLTELSTPNAALLADVEAALLRQKAQDAEVERLKQLEVRMDPRTGAAPRTVATVILALAWVFIPVIIHLIWDITPSLMMVKTSPIAAATAIALWVLGAVSDRKKAAHWTPLNRQLNAMVAFAMAVQAVMAMALYVAGIDVAPYGTTLLSGFWFLVAGLIAVSLIPDVWPASVAYLVSSVVSGIWPATGLWISTAASAVVCINAIVVARREGYQHTR